MNTEERKRVTLTHAANLRAARDRGEVRESKSENQVKVKGKEKGEPGQGERIKEQGLGPPRMKSVSGRV